MLESVTFIASLGTWKMDVEKSEFAKAMLLAHTFLLGPQGLKVNCIEFPCNHVKWNGDMTESICACHPCASGHTIVQQLT